MFQVRVPPWSSFAVISSSPRRSPIAVTVPKSPYKTERLGVSGDHDSVAGGEG
jgi:hypothetical protein